METDENIKLLIDKFVNLVKVNQLSSDKEKIIETKKKIILPKESSSFIKPMDSVWMKPIPTSLREMSIIPKEKPKETIKFSLKENLDKSINKSTTSSYTTMLKFSKKHIKVIEVYKNGSEHSHVSFHLDDSPFEYSKSPIHWKIEFEKESTTIDFLLYKDKTTNTLRFKIIDDIERTEYKPLVTGIINGLNRFCEDAKKRGSKISKYEINNCKTDNFNDILSCLDISNEKIKFALIIIEGLYQLYSACYVDFYESTDFL